MKEGKFVGKNKNIFVFVFLLLLATLIIVGFFSGFFGRITTLATNPVGVNITVGAAVIVDVGNGSTTQTLIAGPRNTTRTGINFTVYHGAGTTILDDSTLFVNATLWGGTGEMTRNASCTRYNSSASYVTYYCNLTLFWYDGAGTWNLTAFIKDNNSNAATNSTATFSINSLTGFEIAPTNLTWAAIAPGSTNQTSSNDPVNLTNTGNQQFGVSAGNVSVNSTNLQGEVTSSQNLFAANFTAATVTGGACTGSACTECGAGNTGSNLNNTYYKNITSAFLPKGNYSVGDTTTGREQLHFCLRIAGSELSSQSYSTLANGAWTIQVA